MTKILILPGLGDIYWVFVKLKDWLDKNGITEKPEIYTWELQPQKFNRSQPYIERCPFVRFGGNKILPQDQDFKDIYFGTTWLKEQFHEFDYLISFNGILRNGFTLEDFGLDRYKSDWYFKMTEPSDTEQAFIGLDGYVGDFILAYFTNDGMYSNTWLKHLPLPTIASMLKTLHEETGYRIVLSGSNWDRPFAHNLMKELSGGKPVNDFFDQTQAFINKVGHTQLDGLFSLIQEAKGMIGWPGGNTIKSVYFKKPTSIIWSKYFTNSAFYKNCVAPDSDTWYNINIAEEHTPTQIVDDFLRML